MENFALKMTGSSIADYSDGDSFRLNSSDAFSSTDRIIQHPIAASTNEKVQMNLRLIKGTNRPVFLPKPRIHRVNGYPMDSCRMITGMTRSSSRGSGKSRLGDKLTAPFRIGTSKIHNGLTSSYKNLDKKSKFDFRDSAWIDEEEGQGGVKAPSRQNSLASRAAQCPRQSQEHRGNHMTAGATLECDEISTDLASSAVQPQLDGSLGPMRPSQFPFPLVPLSEAARRQAIARANGDDDQTFLSGSARGDSSDSSRTNSTQRTSPMTPLGWIRTPNPAHLSGPREYDAPGKYTQSHTDSP
jgi:hypothetical protein